jgi:hypothetical protein
MIKLKYLFEIKNKDLMNYSEMKKHFRISDSIGSIKNDVWVDWNNKNYKSGILRILKNPKAQLLSKIQLYFSYIVNKKGLGNWGEKRSLKGFKNALKQDIIIWRGGGGNYDPNFKHRSFVSFTISKERRIKNTIK